MCENFHLDSLGAGSRMRQRGSPRFTEFVETVADRFLEAHLPRKEKLRSSAHGKQKNLILVCLFALLALTLGTFASAQVKEAPRVPDSLIVVFQGQPLPADAADRVKQAGGKVVSMLDEVGVLVVSPVSVDGDTLIRNLRKDRAILDADYDRVLQLIAPAQVSTDEESSVSSGVRRAPGRVAARHRGHGHNEPGSVPTDAARPATVFERRRLSGLLQRFRPELARPVGTRWRFAGRRLRVQRVALLADGICPRRMQLRRARDDHSCPRRLSRNGSSPGGHQLGLLFVCRSGPARLVRADHRHECRNPDRGWSCRAGEVGQPEPEPCIDSHHPPANGAAYWHQARLQRTVQLRLGGRRCCSTQSDPIDRVVHR